MNEIEKIRASSVVARKESWRRRGGKRMNDLLASDLCSFIVVDHISQLQNWAGWENWEPVRRALMTWSSVCNNKS